MWAASSHSWLVACGVPKECSSRSTQRLRDVLHMSSILMENIRGPRQLWENGVGDKTVSHHCCTSSLWTCFATYTWSLHMDSHWGIPAVFISLEMLGRTQPSLLLPLPTHSKLSVRCGRQRCVGPLQGSVIPSPTAVTTEV